MGLASLKINFTVLYYNPCSIQSIISDLRHYAGSMLSLAFTPQIMFQRNSHVQPHLSHKQKVNH